MTTQELIIHAIKMQSQLTYQTARQTYVEACEFFKIHVGANTSFYKALEKSKGNESYWNVYQNVLVDDVLGVLNGFISYATSGLYDEVSQEKKTRLDVVNGYLEQAQYFLTDKEIHPAAAAVIIGSSLEEFLRNWFASEGLSLEGTKPGIDTYVKKLREKDLITKQDSKNITAYAGIRNDAAHGFFDKINREQVDLMLQGVNLFLGTYQKK